MLAPKFRYAVRPPCLNAMTTPPKPDSLPFHARIAVTVMFLLNGTVFASWVPHIPAVKARLDINDGQLGLLLLCIAAGSIASLALSGWLVARFGSRRLTVAAAIGLCLMLPVPVVSASTFVVAASLALFGVFNGALDVAMNAQAVEVQRRYGRSIMSAFHGCFSLGGLIGAGLAGLLLKLGVPGLEHASAITAVGLLSAVLAGSWLLPSARSNTAREPVFVRPTGALLPLGVLALCALLIEGAMADWSAVYLADAHGASLDVAATGYAVFSLTMAAGRFGGDRLIDRFGVVSILRTCAVLATAGLLLTVVGGQAAALAGFACIGFGMANIIPLLFTAAGRVPDVEPGRALAAVASAGYFGFLVGPPFIGFVAHALSLPAAFGLMAILCATLALRARLVASLHAS
jgi:MFS family permease